MAKKKSTDCVNEPSFKVKAYRITWVAAEEYDPIYNIVPTITLFENDKDIDAGIKRNATAIIFFRQNNTNGGSYNENVYYLNFPLSAIESITNLIESGKRLTVQYRCQEDRHWVELRTDKIPLVKTKSTKLLASKNK